MATLPESTEANGAPMPTHVKVGLYVYTVTQDGEAWAKYVNDGTAKDRMGFSDHNLLIIAVNPGVSPMQKADTLLHEVLHACWWNGSIGSLEALSDNADHEEFIISHMSPWLLMVLRDNPELLDYLENPE